MSVLNQNGTPGIPGQRYFKCRLVSSDCDITANCIDVNISIVLIIYNGIAMTAVVCPTAENKATEAAVERQYMLLTFDRAIIGSAKCCCIAAGAVAIVAVAVLAVVIVVTIVVVIHVAYVLTTSYSRQQLRYNSSRRVPASLWH